MTRWCRHLRTPASAVIVVVLASACAGDGSEPIDDVAMSERAGAGEASSDSIAAAAEPASPALAGSVTVSADDDAPLAVEDRLEIGPRAVDLERSMTMVVDSLDASGDDIFIRLRIANFRDEYLDLGVQHTRIGPLVVMYDDRGSSYESLAVEPAGIQPSSVGYVRFRLAGPLDPAAEEFIVELASQRGTLITPPAPTPIGGSVRWMDARASSTPGPTVTHGERVIRAREFVDHGTHVEILIEASDSSNDLAVADMLDTTLIARDGTRIQPFGLSAPAEPRVDVLTAELRFPVPPSGMDDVTLEMAGVAVGVPDVFSPAPDVDPSFAESPRLPDLLDQWITFERLSTATEAAGPGS